VSRKKCWEWQKKEGCPVYSGHVFFEVESVCGPEKD
jgi:hypothetical protein